MKRLLRECSPHFHPHRWIAINCTILIWSTILLARIWKSTESQNDDEKTRIEFSYLVYNFGTCVVWLNEVFFNVLDHKRYLDSREGFGGEESLLQPIHKVERTKNEVIALWIEVALAAYFFVDSTSIAVHLSRKQIHREAKGMTFDVCINVAAYGFMVYRQFVHWKTSEQNNGNTQHDSSTDEGALVGGVV